MTAPSEPVVRNARIENARLGFGGHDAFLDHFVTLDYGGMGQGWGGYVLGFRDDRRDSASLAGNAIVAILNAVGVVDWSGLDGSYCRALAEPGKVWGIGHILRDKWVWLDKEGVHSGTLAELREAGARRGETL